MNMKQIAVYAVATLLFLSGSALAQEMVIYPSQGQSNEQMEQDKFQCYSWSKNESGFDPMALPTASTPPPAKEAQKGGVARGAVRGRCSGEQLVRLPATRRVIQERDLRPALLPVLWLAACAAIAR